MINTNMFASSPTATIPSGSITGDLIATNTITNSNIGLAEPSISYVATPVTTTSTTAFSTVSSLSYTPNKTGNLKISATVIGNNNTAGDGYVVQLSVNGKIELSTSFISSKALQNQTWSVEYFETGLTVGTSYSIFTEIKALTGGTASAIGTLLVAESLA